MTSSDPDFFGVFQAELPVGVGVKELEFVLFAFAVGVMVRQHIFGFQSRGVENEIGAGGVEGDGVKGSRDAEIGNDRGVVVSPAVAFRGDVHNKADMEVGLVFQYRLGVLVNTGVERTGIVVRFQIRALELTNRDALTAANAFAVVDNGFLRLLVKRNRFVTAMLDAQPAAAAGVRVNNRLGRRVHFEFAGHSAAAHAEVLNCSANSRRFVSLEMRQRNEDVSVNNRRADFGSGTVLAVDGDFPIIQTLQAVADYHLTASGKRIEPVDHGGLKMVNGVLSASGIERVTVRQKRLGAQRCENLNHPGNVVRANVREVSQLAEMNFQSDELVLKRQLFYARLANELFHVVQQIVRAVGSDADKINFRGRCHDGY